jgi:hypothetical protein
METILVAAALGAVIAVLLSAYVLTRRRPLSGIMPASELQRRYGLYAENRPIINLRHLVPLAEKWGIGDDIIRNDYIDKASDEEKRDLHDALYEPFEQITAWLTSFPAGRMTPEAEAFMYAQGALDEMGFFILDEKASGEKSP